MESFSAYGVYNLKTDSGYTTAFGSNDTPRIGQFPTAFNGQIRNVATTDSGDSLLRSDLADNTNIVFNGNVSTTTNDLYINGVLKDTDTFTGNLANASNSLFSFCEKSKHFGNTRSYFRNDNLPCKSNNRPFSNRNKH